MVLGGKNGIGCSSSNPFEEGARQLHGLALVTRASTLLSLWWLIRDRTPLVSVKLILNRRRKRPSSR